MSSQKKKLDFKTFNDGTVRLMLIDGNNKLDTTSERTYRFNEKTIGIKRFFIAKTADVKIDKVIEIHQDKDITGAYAAVIDKTRYKIEQVQHISDSLPPTSLLSLSVRGLYKEGYDEV